MEQILVFKTSEGKLFIQFSNMFRHEMSRGKVTRAMQRVKEAIRRLETDQPYFEATEEDYEIVQRWCRGRCLVSANPLESIPKEDLPFEYTRVWAYVKPDGELTTDETEAKDSWVYSRVIDRLKNLGYEEEAVEAVVEGIISAPDFQVILEDREEDPESSCTMFDRMFEEE